MAGWAVTSSSPPKESRIKQERKKKSKKFEKVANDSVTRAWPVSGQVGDRVGDVIWQSPNKESGSPEPGEYGVIHEPAGRFTYQD
jgi:hypothetical protein